MELSSQIKEEATRLGFDACGIAQSRILEGHREKFSSWLKEGNDGNLGYLSRHLDKRFDPAELVPGARSVVVCTVSYNRGVPSLSDSNIADYSPEYRPKIASYALARDYHITLRERINGLLDFIRQKTGSSGRAFIDTAPILEKAWAEQAGIGWIGRNSLLIHPRLGSFILLAVIVTDAELAPDPSFPDNKCGNCRQCIDSCPVGAIRNDRTINARRCIARHTIEKEPDGTPEFSLRELHGWLFGCDICQLACPYNRKAPIIDHEFFTCKEGLREMTIAEWHSIADEEFIHRFGETPLARCGLERIKKRLPQP